MNDVGLEFKGDAHEALAAYEKMIEAQNKQIAKLQQASDTSKKGHSEFQGQVAEQIKSLASMAAGYVTIQSAVGFVTGAYREWKQEIMALGAEHTKFSQTLVRDLVQAGDIKRGPEIEAWLNTLPAGGATLEQGRAALAAVTAASPSQTLERRMGIAAEVTRSAPWESTWRRLRARGRVRRPPTGHESARPDGQGDAGPRAGRGQRGKTGRARRAPHGDRATDRTRREF